MSSNGRLHEALLPGAPEGARWATEEARIRSAYGRRGGHERYSWFNRAHLLGMQEVERTILRALARHGVESLDDASVLEVGCGSAVWLREFIKWGVRPERAVGIDLLAHRVEQARRLCPTGVTLQCGSAAQLPFGDHAFDLVLQSMLISSVLDGELRRCVAAEMRRVLRPNGLILWYDYHVNNPRNPDVRRVSKGEVRTLFPGCDSRFERVTLAAPLARLVAPRSTALYRALGLVPWLKTHYLAIIREPSRPPWTAESHR